MKSYTDISQSKKLAEILPIDSADMGYAGEEEDSIFCGFGDVEQELYTDYGDGHPCWSLAALLDLLPTITKGKENANPFIAKTQDNKYYVVYATFTEEVDSSAICDNPVDACVDMVISLYKLKML